jgi:multiple antibiotic resistance protein
MLDDDARQFLRAFLLVVGGILPIVNPLGSAPVFLAMTRGTDPDTRRMLALKVAINTFVLIMASLIFGAFVLRLFGLSIPVVEVAGGAVLCALGWNLLTSDAPDHQDTTPVPSQVAIMRAFYPLTLPVTVDPGAISVAVAVGANHAHGIERLIIAFLAATLAVLVIAAAVWLAYHYAQGIAHRLGHTRMMVVLRLSAFIVLCIGVEITWNGIKTLAAELPFAMAPVPAPGAPPAKAQ